MLAQAFDHMLERLERAFKRQRDFVSDASHELRTPLAVLRAQVELLDRETDERRRHEGTTTLLRRLDELDRLVGDMLTLASAEAGRLVEPRAIELDDYFEDLRRDLPLFGERDFQLEAVGGTLRRRPRPAHPGSAQPRPQRRSAHRAGRHDQRDGSRAKAAAGWRSRSPTPARASPPTSSNPSSSASIASTAAALATGAAAASASRSRARSSRRTAARSPPSHSPGTAPPSGSCCQDSPQPADAFDCHAGIDRAAAPPDPGGWSARTRALHSRVPPAECAWLVRQASGSITARHAW